MEKRLSHILRLTARVDEILIAGEERKGLLKNLCTTFEIIKNCALRLKKTKCSFFEIKVLYLGYLITEEGISSIGPKLEKIINLPEPKKESELKTFLGMLNYYHRYLSNLSRIVELLHEFLCKGAEWKRQDRQKKKKKKKRFSNAKMMIFYSKLLVHYDSSKPLVVSCHAPLNGIGAVISHTMPDESERPIAYESRTLSRPERKKGLAVAFMILICHQYLYGHSFTIFTNHKPLLGLIGENKFVGPLAAAWIQHWALLLSTTNLNTKMGH